MAPTKKGHKKYTPLTYTRIRAICKIALLSTSLVNMVDKSDIVSRKLRLCGVIVFILIVLIFIVFIP